MQLTRQPLGRCLRDHMRAWLNFGLALLIACSPRAPYPLPAGWARLPEPRTKAGSLISLGLAAPRPADSAYTQQLLCLSHSPCYRFSMDMFLYKPSDTTLISALEVGTDSAGIVIHVHMTLTSNISFDSAFQVFRSVLGKPREFASTDKPYFPFAAWRRDDLELNVYGPNSRRPGPVTAYLGRRPERGYGMLPRPDISWQLRACEEFSYQFCQDIRP